MVLQQHLTTVKQDMPDQIVRVQLILDCYYKAGRAHTLRAMLIEQALRHTERAVRENNDAVLPELYNQLKEVQSDEF